MYKAKAFVFAAVSLTALIAAGCGDSSADTAAAQETPPATAAAANPGANTGLAAPRQDLKNRAQSAAQSTESPVGAPKTTMQ